MRTASKIVLRVTEELLLGAYTGNVALFHAIYIISEVSHHLTGSPFASSHSYGKRTKGYRSVRTEPTKGVRGTLTRQIIRRSNGRCRERTKRGCCA